jgi:hypothetical protein
LCSVAATEKEPLRSQAFRDHAINLLNQLVDLGYSNVLHFHSDPDFAVFAEDERFLAILEKLLALPSFATLHRADTTRTSHLHIAAGLADIKEMQMLFQEQYRPVTFVASYHNQEGLMGSAEATHDSILTTHLLLHRPTVPESAKEALALQQARAAIALFRMNATERVWPLLRHSIDPRLRSYVLDYMTRYGIDPNTLLKRLEKDDVDVESYTLGCMDPSASADRAVIIGLGNFAEAGLLTEAQVAKTKTELLRRYLEHPDPGIHGACEWTLKKIGAGDELTALRQELATGQRIGNREWFVTQQGEHTFAILHAEAPFLMGSPITEVERYGGPARNDEALHQRQIDRTFAIATHEVTVEQFSRFRPDHIFNRAISRESDAPANLISWYDAAAYCNWLSKREGLPPEEWCYNPEQVFADGMVLPSDYLNRTGYRLPTEAEWEFACRAGTRSARYFGETESLLPQYAWYYENSRARFALPVGSLRPNDFGIFDLYGNVLEWCQETTSPYPYGKAVFKDTSLFSTIRNSMEHQLRGGSYHLQAVVTRSSSRLYLRPEFRLADYGFRLARTYR